MRPVSTGNAVVASFDGPDTRRSVHTGHRLDAETFGIELRAGLHAGEPGVRGDELADYTFKERLASALSPPTEKILLSDSLHELVAGCGIACCERGEYEPEGVPLEGCSRGL
jgi:hypothetical protein